MKRILALILAATCLLALCACSGGGSAGTQQTQPQGPYPRGGFRAGFGRADLTPRESVPMSGYGNSTERMSTGVMTFIYANVVAVDDGTNTLLLITADYGWFQTPMVDEIAAGIVEKYGIPMENILFQGTHSHAGPDFAATTVPAIASEMERAVQRISKAVDDALADLKPAKMYGGIVETENMNFVRRYIMDDGSLIGDNYPGTGTTIVRHETEVDNDLQLVKFVREGGKDILIMNFQSHPQLETRSTDISGQTPATMRASVEEKLDIYTTYWNGAAGNINPTSRIESEIRTSDMWEYGKIMADYVADAYDSLEPLAAGPVSVTHRDVVCMVNHTEDYLVPIASTVSSVWKSTNSSAQALAKDPEGVIASPYHANAILAKAGLGESRTMPIAAFRFGDVCGAVVPYEMFDTSGMQIKAGSGYGMTMIFGYANTGSGSYSYMPDEKAFENVGYEGNQCRFIKGTAEQLVAEYLDMLEEIK